MWRWSDVMLSLSRTPDDRSCNSEMLPIVGPVALTALAALLEAEPSNDVGRYIAVTGYEEV